MCSICGLGQEKTKLDSEKITLEFRFVFTQPQPDAEEVKDTRTGTTLYAKKEVLFSEKDLIWAKAQRSGENDQWGIQFSFTDEAKSRFAEFTEKNIGKRLGIFLNRKLLAAPAIVERINGSGFVPCQFTEAEARKAADGLNRATSQPKR